MDNKQFAGFDPTGLERAAMAVRELNQSPHAGQAIQLSIKQSEERKAHSQLRQKEKEIEKTKVEQEEKRKTLDKQLSINKQSSDYQDQLEKARNKDKLLLQEKSQEKIRLQNEESVRKQEDIRRKTIEYQFEKQAEFEEKKSVVQAKMQAQILRDTHDLTQQNIVLQEKERRNTLKELFELNYKHLSQFFTFVIQNPNFAANIALYTAGITGAYFLSKGCINLGVKYLEAHFSKPALIRETSRLTYKEYYKVPFKWLSQNLFYNPAQRQKQIFRNIILDQDLKQQLLSISYSLINQRKNLAPLRNILFHGPPGTGKTLFAKNLAYFSGMDYAIMTGADIAPLGTGAVNELNKIFDWAEKSSRGMLLFIDEADAFFRRRDSENSKMSENLRNAINTFLYKTGSPSKKYMFVLATNTPEQLDKALADRVDQMLLFDLPQLKERTDILFMYFVKYCQPTYRMQDKFNDFLCKPTTIFYYKKLIRMRDIDEEYIKTIAQRTDGFSSRELEKFVISCHDIAFSKRDPVLDKNIVEDVLTRSIAAHRIREKWIFCTQQQNSQNQNKENVDSDDSNQMKKEHQNLKSQMKFFSNAKNKFSPKPFLNLYQQSTQKQQCAYQQNMSDEEIGSHSGIGISVNNLQIFPGSFHGQINNNSRSKI